MHSKERSSEGNDRPVKSCAVPHGTDEMPTLNYIIPDDVVEHRAWQLSVLLRLNFIQGALGGDDLQVRSPMAACRTNLNAVTSDGELLTNKSHRSERCRGSCHTASIHFIRAWRHQIPGARTCAVIRFCHPIGCVSQRVEYHNRENCGLENTPECNMRRASTRDPRSVHCRSPAERCPSAIAGSSLMPTNHSCSRR